MKRMEFLRFEIITKMERNLAISMIKDLITGSGGWIVDHHLFSNTSASLNFEMPYRGIEGFIANLKKAEFNPTILQDCSRDRKGEVRGGLALIFVHNEPDMKRDVPAFG